MLVYSGIAKSFFFSVERSSQHQFFSVSTA